MQVDDPGIHKTQTLTHFATDLLDVHPHTSTGNLGAALLLELIQRIATSFATGDLEHDASQTTYNIFKSLGPLQHQVVAWLAPAAVRPNSDMVMASYHVLVRLLDADDTIELDGCLRATFLDRVGVEVEERDVRNLWFGQ